MSLLLSRAAPLCLLLICLPAEPAPSARPAPLDAPSTMQGFLRYKVRGLSAVQGGFMSGSIMVVATQVGMQSAMVNMLRLIGGMAKLSGNPGMAEMHNYLRTGKGFDFSGAPVSAGYDVHLDFVLVSDGKGNYRLKSGNATYSGNTDADLALNSPDGNNHRFTDRFHGQGTAKLTPENASITLTTTGKGKTLRGQFDVDVSFPVAVVGKTVWSAMGGLIVISREDKADASTWRVVTPFGPEHSDTEQGGSQWPAGVSYSYSGPPEKVLRGRETWQDMTDGGQMVEWELWDDCSATILSPEKNDELVYDRSTPAKIERLALARVQPSFWEQDLHWSFHEISGSDLEPRPDKSNGNDFDVSYTKLPEKNSSFAFWKVEARFDTDRARKAGCKDPKPHDVGYFFPRTGTNNPGASARAPEAKGAGPDPNWFFYWQQTPAGNRTAATRYGGGSKWCTQGVGGYYSLGTSYIVVCDLEPDWSFTFSHPFVPLKFDGIDTYAAVVLHEWRHHDDYKKWWPAGHSAVLDSDDDLIPDLLEPQVAVPAPLNGKHKFFDNNMHDTIGRGYNDAHYFAYMAMTNWKSGSADTQDWSCPGHQAFGNC